MEKRFTQLLIIIYIFAVVERSFATLLSDAFVGKSRGALQDGVPTWDSSDPYEVMGNPSWRSRRSEIAMTHTLMGTSLGNRAQEEELTQVFVFSINQKYSEFSVGAFGFVPTGTQPILDTGSRKDTSSPWSNMTRQMLYAAHVSYQPIQSRWSFGGIIPVSFDTEARASTELQSELIHSRASVYLRPRLSYGIGATFKEVEGFGASLFYKEQSKSKAEAIIEGNIPALDLELYFAGQSFYSFDPRRVSLNFFHQSSGSLLGLRLRYSQWSKYEAPYIIVTDSSLTLRDQEIVVKAENSWDLALAWDQALNQYSSLSTSIGFRQSPFKKIKTLYDADHYIVGLGYRAELFKKWSAALSLRAHILSGGGVYTWTGLGVGYRL